MADFVALVIILIAVGAAVAYIVRQKKRGVKCIGCTAGQNACSAAKEGAAGCSGCSAVDKMVANMKNEVG